MVPQHHPDLPCADRVPHGACRPRPGPSKSDWAETHRARQPRGRWSTARWPRRPRTVGTCSCAHMEALLHFLQYKSALPFISKNRQLIDRSCCSGGGWGGVMGRAAPQGSPGPMAGPGEPPHPDAMIQDSTGREGRKPSPIHPLAGRSSICSVCEVRDHLCRPQEPRAEPADRWRATLCSPAPWPKQETCFFGHTGWAARPHILLHGSQKTQATAAPQGHKASVRR